MAQAYVSIIPTTKGFKGKLDKELAFVGDYGHGFGFGLGQNLLGGFGRGVGGLAKLVTAGLGGAAVGKFVASTVKEASGLNEAINKTRLVFGDSEQQIRDWAKTSVTQMGLSERAALDAAGTFGAMLLPVGTSLEKTIEISTGLTQIAADLASTYDREVEDALIALRSGIIGEQEPLRRFGVNITEARLKLEALNSGLISATVDTNALSKVQERLDKAQRRANKALAEGGENSVEYTDALRDMEQADADIAKVLEGKVPATLDANIKQQAAYNIIVHDTQIAQGDFVRTSEELANQLRIAKGGWENLKGEIGQGFLPVAKLVVQTFNRGILPAFSQANKVFQPLLERIGVGVTAAFDAAKAGTVDPNASGPVQLLTQVFLLVRELGAHIESLIPRLQKGLDGAFEKVGKAAAFVSDHFDKVRIALKFIVPLVLAAAGAFTVFTHALGAGLVVQRFFYLIRRGITLANPLTLIVSAAFALGTAFVTLYKTSKPFKAFVDGIITKLRDNRVFERFTEVFGATGPVVQAAANAFKGLLAALRRIDFKSFGINAEKAANFIGGVLVDALLGLLDLIERGATKLSQVDFEAVFVEIGRALEPVIEGIGAFAKAFADWLRENWPTIKEALRVFAEEILPPIVAGMGELATILLSGLVDALDGLGEAFQFLADHMGVTAPLLTSVVAGVLAYKTLMKALTPILWGATIAQMAFNLAQKGNKVALVVAVIVALIAAMVVAYKNSERFRAIVDSVGRALRTAFFASVNWLNDHVVPVLASIAKFVVDSVWPALRGVGLALYDGARAAIAWLLDTAFPAIAGFASRVWTAVSPVLASVGGALLDGLGKVIDWLQGTAFPALSSFVSYVADKVGGAASSVGGGLASGLRTAVDFIIDTVIPTMGRVAVAVGGALYSAFKAVAGFITDTVIPAVRELNGWFEEHVQPVVRNLAGLVGEVLGLAFQVVGDIIREVAIPVIKTLAKVIVDTIVPGVKVWAKVVGGPLLATLKAFGRVIRDVIVPYLKLNLHYWLEQVSDFFTKVLVPGWKRGWANFGKHIRDVGRVTKTVIEWMLDNFDNFIDQARGFVEVLGIAWDWVAEHILPIIGDLGTSLLDVMREDGWPALKSFVGFLRQEFWPTLQRVAGYIRDNWREAWDTMWKVMEVTVIPGLRKFGTFVEENVWPALKVMATVVKEQVLPNLRRMWDVFNEDILPIIKEVVIWIKDELVPRLIDVWREIDANVVPKLKDLWGEIYTNVVPNLGELWDKLQALWKIIKEEVLPRLKELWETFTNNAELIGTFLGNAKRDFDSFLDAVRFVKDSIAAIFSADTWAPLANGFIDAINFIIRKWNELDFSIPKITVAGVTFGGVEFNLPDIEELDRFIPKGDASKVHFFGKGALVKQRTLAWIGEDSRTTPEIVSPVATMREIVRKELREGLNETIPTPPTRVHIEHFHSSEPSRSLLEEMQWRIMTGVI